MVAALTLALALWYPPPVASFSAPSVVRLGQPISYVDDSFDPAPGHHIILQIWSGRAGALYQTGYHTVSLAVEDDRGMWGATSRSILVVRPLPPPPPPPPPVPAATLTASPTTAFRGDRVTLSLTAGQSVQSIFLALPAAFVPQVALASGVIDYAAINSAPWVFQGGAWRTSIWIPWTQSDPADGSYALTATYRQGGQSLSARTVVTVDGTDRLVLWRVP